MNNARIIHTIAENMVRKQTAEDPFFAKGPMATYLKQQALALAYFGKVNYEDALRQIHKDFGLAGTPYETKGGTTPTSEQLRIIAKHFEDTHRDRPRIEIGNLWYVVSDGALLLRPKLEKMVCFESINLYNGRILYNHEFEGVSTGFKHFLTIEDHQAFVLLATDIQNRKT